MSDLSLPADYPIVPPANYDELKLVRLAREIAMDLNELPKVLDTHGITHRDFEIIKTLPRFQSILASELEAWQSAVNTHERVKIKASAVVEEWLPELYARLNDVKEPLMAKIKGGELLAKLAGMGLNNAQQVGDPSDRINITINLGEDRKLQFEQALPGKVIEHEATPADTAEDA